MNPIFVTRDKGILFLRKEGDTKVVRFNLQTAKMQRENDKGLWENVSHQHQFFKGYRVEDLKFDEQKFSELLKLAREMSRGCKSISTYLTNFGKTLKLEGFIQRGIRFEQKIEHNYGYGRERSTVRTLSHFIHEFDAHAIKFFKKHNAEVKVYFERKYFAHKDLTLIVLNKIDAMSINSERANHIYNEVFSRDSDDFYILLLEHKCEPGALLGYLFDYLEPFENLNFRQSTDSLKDYLGMSKQIGRSAKKYPKYLHSMHDIIAANFKSFKAEYDQMAFVRMQKPELEWAKEDFIVRIPSTPKDIIQEGTALNHCVGSYVEQIIRGSTYIAFLRIAKNPEESLVTLEIRDGALIQAKGSCNRPLVPQEAKIIRTFCNEKNLRCVVTA